MLKRLAKPIALLLATIAFGGCLYDATLDAKGGGTMTVKYRLTSEAQFRAAQRRMESPHVKLVSSEVDKDKWATFAIQFDDITKLPTAEFFARSTISLIDDAEGTTTLTTKFNNQEAVKLLDELIDYFGKDVTLSIHLPGEIVKSNGSETAGTTAKWSFPLRDFTENPEVVMSVTFKKTAAPAAPAPAAAEPAAPAAPAP